MRERKHQVELSYRGDSPPRDISKLIRRLEGMGDYQVRFVPGDETVLWFNNVSYYGHGHIKYLLEKQIEHEKKRIK